MFRPVFRRIMRPALRPTSRVASRALLCLAMSLSVLFVLTGCESQRRLSDAELGLNEQQARGRHVFDAQCARCHEPYSASGRKGPSLKHMYQKPYMPSGLPTNDERVSEVIMRGRKMMPGFSQTINERQLEDLLAYLKTL